MIVCPKMQCNIVTTGVLEVIVMSSAWHTAVGNNVTCHSSVARKNILLAYYGVVQLKRLVKNQTQWLL